MMLGQHPLRDIKMDFGCNFINLKMAEGNCAMNSQFNIHIFPIKL